MSINNFPVGDSTMKKIPSHFSGGCRGVEGGGARAAIEGPVGRGGKLLSGRNKYSQLSLSRLRLSRITAYLEEKIWSLF